MERLRPQQVLHEASLGPSRLSQAPEELPPSDPPSQHSEPDERAREVVHQQRLPGPPCDPLPGVDQIPARRRVPHEIAADQLLGGLRHHEAGGEREHDAEQRSVQREAGDDGGHNSAERERFGGERERDAPVAPARARLLGAGVRRGPLLARQGRQHSERQEPAAEEHGGHISVRMDRAEVRGRQSRGVGLPLPHRAPPPHGNGSHHLSRRPPCPKHSSPGSCLWTHRQPFLFSRKPHLDFIDLAFLFNHQLLLCHHDFLTPYAISVSHLSRKLSSVTYICMYVCMRPLC